MLVMLSSPSPSAGSAAAPCVITCCLCIEPRVLDIKLRRTPEGRFTAGFPAAHVVWAAWRCNGVLS